MQDDQRGSGAVGVSGNTHDSSNSGGEVVKPKQFPLEDSTGYIELLDFMGGDGTITDRARKCYHSQDKSSPEADDRLLKRLVGSKPLHGTTLRGTVMTFDVVLPLFCMRQWVRHLAGHEYHGFSDEVWNIGTEEINVAGAFDEMSFRYVDPLSKDIQFYVPPPARLKGEGSLIEKTWWKGINQGLALYKELRDLDVEKGLARSFLPQCIYTQMEWTVNLQAFLDWYYKRMAGGGAQWEITQYANSAWKLVESYVAPKTCRAFKESKGK